MNPVARLPGGLFAAAGYVALRLFHGRTKHRENFGQDYPGLALIQLRPGALDAGNDFAVSIISNDDAADVARLDGDAWLAFIVSEPVCAAILDRLQRT
ncbi:hypothetical protein [Xanthomonas campestris]|uniref:hypothetical protein n=1 Tax=Xanthomonas campestris TaxID=339 RepID=UPI002B23A384|nr:hypothetical protein [Xanthomonas campestris]MEA9790438.1 hypothetical protein [Xanthomonas campestris pv. raphani]MEA9818574.1 hypothetical protein [Xanthomonas campestris pv. raphani]